MNRLSKLADALESRIFWSSAKRSVDKISKEHYTSSYQLTKGEKMQKFLEILMALIIVGAIVGMLVWGYIELF